MQPKRLKKIDQQLAKEQRRFEKRQKARKGSK